MLQDHELTLKHHDYLVLKHIHKMATDADPDIVKPLELPENAIMCPSAKKTMRELRQLRIDSVKTNIPPMAPEELKRTIYRLHKTGVIAGGLLDMPGELTYSELYVFDIGFKPDKVKAKVIELEKYLLEKKVLMPSDSESTAARNKFGCLKLVSNTIYIDDEPWSGLPDRYTTLFAYFIKHPNPMYFSRIVDDYCYPLKSTKTASTNVRKYISAMNKLLKNESADVIIIRKEYLDAHDQKAETYCLERIK